ncbi:ATP-dependent DEAD/H RNA helicase, putative [Trypanosoma cruzi]|nr:ATP-dependent DEAD/H RNA helicase, putative [Trypanosoma cruzi]
MIWAVMMIMMGRTLSGINALLDVRILKLHGNVPRVDRTYFCEVFRHVGGAACRSPTGCSVLHRRGCPRIVSATGGLNYARRSSDGSSVLYSPHWTVNPALATLGTLCCFSCHTRQDASHA